MVEWEEGQKIVPFGGGGGGGGIFAGITHFKSECSSGRNDKST